MRENHQHDPGTAKAESVTLEPLVPAATAGSCCGSNIDAAPAVKELDGVAECPVMTGTPINNGLS